MFRRERGALPPEWLWCEVGFRRYGSVLNHAHALLGDQQDAGSHDNDGAAGDEHHGTHAASFGEHGACLPFSVFTPSDTTINALVRPDFFTSSSLLTIPSNV